MLFSRTYVEILSFAAEREREREARVHSALLLMFFLCQSFRLPRSQRRGTANFLMRGILFDLTKQPVVHPFAQVHRREVAFEVIVRQTLDGEESSWTRLREWTDQFYTDDYRWSRLSEVNDRNTPFILGRVDE
jgi:hypothetical protein